MKGFDNLGEASIAEILKYSLVEFIDWGLCEKGGLVHVTPLISSSFGFSQLYPVEYFSAENVWAARRKNWSYLPNAIEISGIYIDNVFTTSGYRIDYDNGLVFLDQPANSVNLSFSYKYIDVFDCDANGIFRADFHSFNINDSTFIVGSGYEYPESRIQFPAIGIEYVDGSSKPYELGTTAVRHNDKFLLHIFSEDAGWKDKLGSILESQKEKSFNVFDKDKIAASGVLNPYYENLYDYKWGKCKEGRGYIKSAVYKNDGKISPHFHHGTVKIETETIIYL